MRVGETLTFCLRHVCVKHQRPPSDEGSESRVLLECRAVADIPPWPELAFLSRIIGNPRGREPGFVSSSFCDFDFPFESGRKKIESKPCVVELFLRSDESGRNSDLLSSARVRQASASTVRRCVGESSSVGVSGSGGHSSVARACFSLANHRQNPRGREPGFVSCRRLFVIFRFSVFRERAKENGIEAVCRRVVFAVG